MTVEEIYRNLYSQAWRKSASICDVRTVCVEYKTCADKSTTDVIDFDDYAEQYKQQKGIGERPQSVDAVAIDASRQCLLLIEKKTWYQFYQHQLVNARNETDKKNAIENKINEYTAEIANKYVQSKVMIAHFTGVQDVVDTVRHVLVFLTELAVDYPDPMGGFATALGLLTTTGSFDIRKYTVKKMQDSVTALPAPKKEYVYCKQLDEYVRTLRFPTES